jgi:hypothetical protein
MYEDSYLDTFYEDRYEIFEPTPEQELDWAIHNDHQDDYDDDDGGMFEYGSDEGDDFNDGEFW